MTERAFALVQGEGRDDSSRPNLTIGALSELRAAELLIERGHRVAKPIVDDFGIDLIVDYHRGSAITVQVRCSRAKANLKYTHSSNPVWRFRAFERSIAADIVMFHVRPLGAWWIAPRDVVPMRKVITCMEKRVRTLRRDATYDMDPWRERWDLFDLHGAGVPPAGAGSTT